MEKRNLLLIPLLVLASGCDPCSGVVTCTEPTFRIEGDIYNSLTAEPVSGAAVEFRPERPELLGSEVLTGATVNGRFRMEVEQPVREPVVGELLIYRFPPDSALRSRMTIQPVRTEGDARYVGRWDLPFPHFSGIVSFYYRGNEAPAAGLTVVFRQTGGIVISPSSFSARTDQLGRFRFAPTAFMPGTVEGELVVHLPRPLPPDTIRPFVVEAHFQPNRAVGMGNFGVAPQLPYSGRLVWEDTGELAVGVEVEFIRTGGVPTTPERITMVTNDNDAGNVRIAPLQPWDRGEVNGVLVVRPPPPYREITIEGFRLYTVNHDVPWWPLIDTWAIPRN